MDIVEEMRGFESDHEPDGWPAIQMKQVSALCDEIERLQGIIDKANAKEPYVWDSAGDLIFSIDDGVNGVIPVPLYAAPVPAQQSPDVAVHDEWKYVPIEPTQEMKAAGENAISYKTSAHMIWNEMLAAGPSLSQHRCAQSPRITEQDAREISISYYDSSKPFDTWIQGTGRALLNKLNANAVAEVRQEPAEKILTDIKDQQKNAWLAVCKVLDEVKPDWLAHGKKGIDCAVEAIRSLSQPSQAAAIPEGYTAIKTDVFKWLLGESGDFVCPETDYFRNNPKPYFWRKKLRESALLSPKPDDKMLQQSILTTTKTCE